MNPDELRSRLADIDPAIDMATEPPTTPSSRARLEHIMQIETSRPSPARQRWMAAAAAGVVVVGGAIALVMAGGDDPTTSTATLELGLGESDAMASCMAPSAELLAEMPVAFAGTADSVEGETVTLSVDEWHAGGNGADTVVLRAPSGLEALIDGFTVEVGGEYLISASEGTVNYCGFSGPATPALAAMYDEAFPG